MAINKPYSEKTNAFARMKPRMSSNLRGNFDTIQSPPVSRKQENSDNIMKNSMSKMLIDDFWTAFNENTEKFVKNPIAPRDVFLPGQTPRYNTSMMDRIAQSNNVNIERSKENIYTSTTKTIMMQDRLKEPPTPPPAPTQVGNSYPRAKGGGSQSAGSVTINNMATIDQTIMAAVMLPIWRQGFVG
jgi:hypothetical protein